jgi:hypothetical protein
MGKLNTGNFSQFKTMKSKVHILIGLGALFLFVLVFGVYKIWPETNPSSFNRSTSQFEGWKTCGSEKWGYQIQYPPDLDCAVDPNDVDAIHIQGDTRSYGINVAAIDESTMEEIQALPADAGLQKFILDGSRVICPTANLYSIVFRPITIGGVEGLEAVSSDDVCLKKYLPETIVRKDNRLYRIGFTRGSIDEYGKIISTFKFIEVPKIKKQATALQKAIDKFRKLIQNSAPTSH